MIEVRKVFAFLKKEFRWQLSYRFNFIWAILGAASPLFIFFFIDRLFRPDLSPYLEPYGSSYFAYVLVSLALFNYVAAGLGSISEKLREEEMLGTLESIFVTPTSPYTVLISFGLSNLIVASLELLFYGLVGMVMVRANIQPNYFSMAVILFFSIISFSSLGIISAGFILVFKRGDPLSLAIYGLFSLLGGVYFPVEVLPLPLRLLSSLLPITYAVKAMELAVFRAASIFELSREIIPLFLFSLFLLPLSLFSFRLAMRKARMDGSLSWH